MSATAMQTRIMIDRGFSTQRIPVTNEVMPNLTRNFKGFHVSYVRFIPHYGRDTTALVLQGRVFFVLNGDHAVDMVEAAERNGIQGCIDLFIERIDQSNEHSEHRMAVGVAADPFGLHATTLEMIGQDNVERIIAAAAAKELS